MFVFMNAALLRVWSGRWSDVSTFQADRELKLARKPRGRLGLFDPSA